LLAAQRRREKQVAEEHQISETLRNKLVAIRDEL
jgi:hypothetical protein